MERMDGSSLTAIEKIPASRQKTRPGEGRVLYFVAENLVLYASSEKVGCAVTLHSGMMEY